MNLNLYFVLPDGGEFGSSVEVDSLTGKFDADRAFADLIRFFEPDSVPDTAQYLQVGVAKLQIVDDDKDRVNQADGEMPMRVADIGAFNRAMVAMSTDKPAPQSDEEWAAELAMLEAWQWDGCSIQDIVQRLDLINIHVPGKHKEWRHTVPAECRGKVFYVESSNPVNSEEEVRRYAEILAVDESGGTLVFKTYYNTYTDDEACESAVMTIAEAEALVETYKQRKAVPDLDTENDFGAVEEEYER